MAMWRLAGQRLVAVALCLRAFGLALCAVPVLVFALVVSALTGPTLGPAIAAATRWLTDLVRTLTGIERPYRPRPSAAAGYRARVAWVWTDVATWRDFLWLATEPVVGGVLLLPGVAVLFGWVGLILPGAEGWTGWLFGPDRAGIRVVAVLAGVVLVAAGLALAPAALRWHARWCAVLLAPDAAAAGRLEQQRLAQRVAELTETRSDAADAQAGELRRIERDLHDGAQARLAAATIALGAAEQLFDTDPEAARDLYSKARTAVHTALAELRDLVNGIHPPVLAERGLVDALRALVLDSGLRVTVNGTLPARPPEPVESAAYFAVSELLANVAKHTGDTTADVEIGHAGGMLRILVSDNGPGGADIAKGSGLRGIMRRVGVFDGSLTLSSPTGGPTIATLEIPCVLSSPKTTNSSETR